MVVVPVGATEQHGHHLPLEVDWRLCATVAEQACRRAREAGVPVLLTPPIWTGYSLHHIDFPGSITLDAATFSGLVVHVARSLWYHGFRKILFLNGHGGNAYLLRSAVQILRYEHKVRAVTVNYWDLAGTFIQEWRQSPPGGINHACEMETALMLAIRPEVVRNDRIRDEVWVPHSGYVSGDLTQNAPVTSAWTFAELTRSGVLGNPSLATRERGQKLLQVLVTSVTELLQELHRWDWQDPHGL